MKFDLLKDPPFYQTAGYLYENRQGKLIIFHKKKAYMPSVRAAGDLSIASRKLMSISAPLGMSVVLAGYTGVVNGIGIPIVISLLFLFLVYSGWWWLKKKNDVLKKSKPIDLNIRGWRWFVVKFWTGSISACTKPWRWFLLSLCLIPISIWMMFFTLPMGGEDFFPVFFIGAFILFGGLTFLAQSVISLLYKYFLRKRGWHSVPEPDRLKPTET